MLSTKIRVSAAAIATAAALSITGVATAATTGAMTPSKTTATTASQPTQPTKPRSTSTARTTSKYQTGSGASQWCQDQAGLANDWLEEGDDRWIEGDDVGAGEAEHNGDVIAGAANGNGCELFQIY